MIMPKANLPFELLHYLMPLPPQADTRNRVGLFYLPNRSAVLSFRCLLVDSIINSRGHVLPMAGFFRIIAGTPRRLWRWFAQVWLAAIFSKIGNEARHIRTVERMEHENTLLIEDVKTMRAQIKRYQEMIAAETAIQSRRIAESRGER